MLCLLILLILPAVLLYPCLNFHLFEPDEGRYAQIPREMYERGEWVVPYLQGEPYLDKPPLLYWVVILSYRVFGVDDWVARLGPALAVHFGILLTYLIGRRSLGNRAAFAGALILALAPGFLGVGRLLILDGLLSTLVTLTLLSAFEALRTPKFKWGWWLLSGLTCGLAVLTKGPVAVILLVPPILVYRWLTPNCCRLPLKALVVFVAIVLAIAVPWYVAVCQRLPEFAYYFLWQHNVVRFVQPFDHLGPVWYYIPVVLLGLLPVTLLGVPLLRFLLTGEAEIARRRCPEVGFFLLAGLWCVFFFSMSGSKLPTYIMPAFPALALAAGYCLTEGSLRTRRALPFVAGVVFVCFVAAHYIIVPWYAWYRSPLGRPDEVMPYLTEAYTPVICYSRPCDSIAFYLGRDDLRNIRSQDIEDLRFAVRQQQRTIILCTHRSSLEGLKQALPPEVKIVEELHCGLPDIPGIPQWLSKKIAKRAGETTFGLSDIAVIEMRK